MRRTMRRREKRCFFLSLLLSAATLSTTWTTCITVRGASPPSAALSGVMKDHRTDMYMDMTPIHQEITNEAATLFGGQQTPPKIVVRRDGGAFDVNDILGDTVEAPLALHFESASPGVPEDVDVTQDHVDDSAITFSCDSPVGQYALLSSSGEIVLHIVVIFNPFSEQCSESMASHIHLTEEYVMNTEGLIWHGRSVAQGAAVWNFDQFRGLNLVVGLHLLKRLSLEERKSPVAVSRALTFSIEADMCYGKWGAGSYTSGKAPGGYKCASKARKNDVSKLSSKCTDPIQWTSTSELATQFWLRHLNGMKNTKVQYCQCFVYAGILTTMGRTLGLATRPVTTYRSAHDTNGDKAISEFYWYDEAEGKPSWDPLTWMDLCNSKEHLSKCPIVGEPSKGRKACDSPECRRAISLGEGIDAVCGAEHSCSDCIPCLSGSDSVWEFHVWNDIWMSRPDLAAKGESAGGWQAVDATPQELSDGKNQMGPASVHLVANAVDERCYDQQFVHSEVNADTKYYLMRGATKKEAVAANPIVYAESAGLKKYYKGEKFRSDSWNKHMSIGYQVVTKKIGAISNACRQNTGKCAKHKRDITYVGKTRKAEDTAGYRKRNKDPGIPMLESDVNTASCSFGSAPSQRESSSISSDPMRFPVEDAKLRTSEHIKKTQSHKRSRSQDVEESEEGMVNSLTDSSPDIKRLRASDHSSETTSLSTEMTPPNSNGVTIAFHDTNGNPVIVGQDHVLSVDLTNNDNIEKQVNIGFSGVAVDTRGEPLVRQTLRSGKLIPFRVIMHGRQTHAKSRILLPSGATEKAELVIPKVGKDWGIHGGSNVLIRWVISVIVTGAQEESSSLPPPIYKVVSELINGKREESTSHDSSGDEHMQA